MRYISSIRDEDCVLTSFCSDFRGYNRLNVEVVDTLDDSVTVYTSIDYLLVKEEGTIGVGVRNGSFTLTSCTKNELNVYSQLNLEFIRHKSGGVFDEGLYDKDKTFFCSFINIYDEFHLDETNIARIMTHSINQDFIDKVGDKFYVYLHPSDLCFKINELPKDVYLLCYSFKDKRKYNIHRTKAIFLS